MDLSVFEHTQIPKNFLPKQLGNRITSKPTTPLIPIHSPIRVNGQDKLLGYIPNIDAPEALSILDKTCTAFNYGLGAWPALSVQQRIQTVAAFTEALKAERAEVAKWIMWEIGKTYADALKEFDRTIDYIYSTIEVYKDMVEKTVANRYTIKCKPYGVVFCLGPYNFPFNETLSLAIPALLIGNVVIIKPAKHGVLLLSPLLSLLNKFFPDGSVNILYGDKKSAIKAILQTKKVDVLALIGNGKTAQKLDGLRPQQQLVRNIFSLEAKNPAIVLSDCDVDLAIESCALGALAFNGQRCTALKILLVHKDVFQSFTTKLRDRIKSFKSGMPWEQDVFLTPLPPDKQKFTYLSALIADAQAKGAKIINEHGGQVKGNYMHPAILSPVTAEMDIFYEEQFGPIVPIMPFTDESELMELIKKIRYGQQVSLFTNNNHQLHELNEFLAHQFGRINLNKLCQRGPDILPFSGRKNSATFSLGVENTLRSLSVEVVLDT